MKQFTNTEKRNGELTVRLLSAKAQAGYRMTDPLTVYAYPVCDGDSALVYAVKDSDGLYCGMTLGELEEHLESLAEAYEESEEN